MGISIALRNSVPCKAKHYVMTWNLWSGSKSVAVDSNETWFFNFHFPFFRTIFRRYFRFRYRWYHYSLLRPYLLRRCYTWFRLIKAHYANRYYQIRWPHIFIEFDDHILNMTEGVKWTNTWDKSHEHIFYFIFLFAAYLLLLVCGEFIFANVSLTPQTEFATRSMCLEITQMAPCMVKWGHV